MKKYRIDCQYIYCEKDTWEEALEVAREEAAKDPGQDIHILKVISVHTMKIQGTKLVEEKV